MSLDNVLAVAGAARQHPSRCWCSAWPVDRADGLAATFIARLLHKHRWIAYVGLAIILCTGDDFPRRHGSETVAYSSSRRR
jgi:predicted tellurium resistance membrane protein TerC